MKNSAAFNPSSLHVDAEKGMVLSDQWVPHDLRQVFLFFSDSRNLERLTPAILHFKVMSMSTAEIGEGTDIRYRLKIHGIPVRWISRITDWESPRSFSDIQISGPYRYWCHRHLFESADGGTWIRDRVQYGLPMGFLGQIFLKGFIGNDVKKIFSYRQQVIRELFQ